MKKILVIGNGGREHAIAWKLASSPRVGQVFVAPGNGGTAREAKCTNVPIAVTALPELIHFAKSEAVSFTVIGPEIPLALGIVDAFEAAGLLCLGPSQKAAQLETSKSFCKAFLKRHCIPTARSESFTGLAAALRYLETRAIPIVIKADGLAAGKGVVVAQNREEAIQAVTDFLNKKVLGAAGQKIVIEEFLAGQEVSFIMMCDGEYVVPLATSQDHKARDEGDKGPNTGGMGAYSPAPLVGAKLHDTIMNRIVLPTVEGMAKEEIPYRGFLYAGLMVSPGGAPYVLEFNCRLGDPETEPIMMRLDSDWVDLCEAFFEQRLKTFNVRWKKEAALGVVMASGGYPGAYETGKIITGLERITDPRVKVFHAGTAIKGNQVVTQGGRALCVTALGNTLFDAQRNAYIAVNQIKWPGAFWRRDIGFKAITCSQFTAPQ